LGLWVMDLLGLIIITKAECFKSLVEK
jgi:hypothetical protein